MRITQYMWCVVNGYGMHSSMVATKFEDEVCRVVYADEESADPWIQVESIDPKFYGSGKHTVHASQCSPLPKGWKKP